MIKAKSITPVLRILDIEKAREFYLDFLEFNLDWEHRYEEDYPLYMQVSAGSCQLHLSEHYGDSNPGIKIRIQVEDIKELHQRISSKKYKYARPGLESAHGHLEIRIGDPFGNSICFYEPQQS
ncbi:glyoxalase superfamily protein [Fictibacillus phosphorivorans]|uniref:glyoxalase superfamily protein n=1 Tax=Fictibacillus phosphorivorans TaxID=1221500 RepID=UPI00203D0D72|nr:glyoxalase superfamily protein [Fictibacillus phosphorivorans]MCM3719210.1 glyoxalase superfamily protein [Fictibacillus phosphorivorans]MCM3776832.1 glyoxalase superfamily protein [Fictibacillus phosphorivorans]